MTWILSVTLQLLLLCICITFVYIIGMCNYSKACNMVYLDYILFLQDKKVSINFTAVLYMHGFAQLSLNMVTSTDKADRQTIYKKGIATERYVYWAVNLIFKQVYGFSQLNKTVGQFDGRKK